MTAVEYSEDDGLAKWASWMSAQVTRAAAGWALDLADEPRVGYMGMGDNAHCPATGPDGPRWVRVAVHLDVRPAYPLFWLGNEAANAVTGLPKPQVLDVAEWRDEWAELPCTVRAELMTFLPGRQVQDLESRDWTGVPPDGWWDELDAALAAIRRAPVGPDRCFRPAEELVADVRDVLGVDIEIRRWESAHGDLHWCNVLRDPFGVVDWESWGLYPAATGEAYLYVSALPFPELAEKARERLAPVLDSEDGRVALLVRGAEVVRFCREALTVDVGDLVPVLRQLGARLPD